MHKKRHTPLRKVLKKPIYFMEYILVKVIFHALRLLSFQNMSRFGGALGRALGRIHRRKSAVGRINLQKIFHDITHERVDEILTEVYDNFGRTFIEYCYLDKLKKEDLPDFKVINHDILDALKQSQKPAILFSGHIGNWEIASWYCTQLGIPLTPVYRHMNNPYLDQLLFKQRASYADGLIEKRIRNPQEYVRILKAGGRIALLTDQKMREGMDVPFFGQTAPTATGVVRLAKILKCPIIPMRVIRESGVRFTLEILPPLDVDYHSKTFVYDTLLEMNHMLEQWIVENPGQWFCLHRRWPKEMYTSETIR